MNFRLLYKNLWFIGSFFLMLAVIIGAFGAHGLKQIVTPEKLDTFETGVRYHFFHAFGILFLAAFSQLNPSIKVITTLWAFLIGIILFSFNCYFYVLTGIKFFAMIVPIGGISFIIGWFTLMKSSLKLKLN